MRKPHHMFEKIGKVRKHKAALAVGTVLALACGAYQCSSSGESAPSPDQPAVAATGKIACQTFVARQGTEDIVGAHVTEGTVPASTTTTIRAMFKNQWPKVIDTNPGVYSVAIPDPNHTIASAEATLALPGGDRVPCTPAQV